MMQGMVVLYCAHEQSVDQPVSVDLSYSEVLETQSDIAITCLGSFTEPLPAPALVILGQLRSQLVREPGDIHFLHNAAFLRN